MRYAGTALVVVGFGQLVGAFYIYVKGDAPGAPGTFVVAEPAVDYQLKAPGIASVGALRLRNNGGHAVRVIGLCFC